MTMDIIQAFSAHYPNEELARVNRVNEAIQQEEGAIAAIDVEIEGLMQEIRRLRFKQTNHQDKIRIYRSTITLARRLPQEILASIFECCVQDGWTRFPLTASHVCTQWRSAARTPSVWSHIYVEVNRRDPCGRTLFWLRRSENVPLHVTLDFERDASSPHVIPAVLDLLLQHSKRWKTLKVVSHWLHDANTILNYCSTALFPQLRVAGVAILEDFDTLEDGRRVDQSAQLVSLSASLQGASQLQTINITRNVLSSPTPLPSSLTNLSLNLPSHTISATLSINVLLDILEQAPLLRTLVIMIPRGSQPRFMLDVDVQRTVILPDLNVLTIVGKADLFGVLPYLRTPSLLRLHLRSSLESSGFAVESFGRDIFEFISSTSPPLELLELRDLDLSRDRFISCFSLLPTLEVIRLHESDIPDAVLNSLHGPEALCPRLRTLDLRWCGQITGSALVRLVRGRMIEGLGARLEAINTITLINCAFVGERHVLELSRLVVCRIMMDDVDDYCSECKISSNSLVNLTTESECYLWIQKLWGAAIMNDIAEGFICETWKPFNNNEV
ncbi:hypothetical protein AAF712_002070 [Marasmius tenuissimus]|uniref:F-box domain-containing protein n=1 Tax=Marasmius tenuissimus TaxID=585030 RepID=A0ABR3AC08_9AGAR